MRRATEKHTPGEGRNGTPQSSAGQCISDVCLTEHVVLISSRAANAGPARSTHVLGTTGFCPCISLQNRSNKGKRRGLRDEKEQVKSKNMKRSKCDEKSVACRRIEA
jgi:hypothetical protein